MPGMVAPLAGAWIEIFLYLPSFILILSLPSRERGLKFAIAVFKGMEKGRSPRGSVD